MVIQYTSFSYYTMIWVFERSTFVGSAWSFVFFIPATTVNDLRLRRIFYHRFYPLHLFSYLNSFLVKWSCSRIWILNSSFFTQHWLLHMTLLYFSKHLKQVLFFKRCIYLLLIVENVAKKSLIFNKCLARNWTFCAPKDSICYTVNPPPQSKRGF